MQMAETTALAPFRGNGAYKPCACCEGCSSDVVAICKFVLAFLLGRLVVSLIFQWGFSLCRIILMCGLNS